MRRHFLGMLQRAAVGEIGSDAGRCCRILTSAAGGRIVEIVAKWPLLNEPLRPGRRRSDWLEQVFIPGGHPSPTARRAFAPLRRGSFSQTPLSFSRME